MTLQNVNRLPSNAAALAAFWWNRNLLMQLWKRDFVHRYKNGLLGVFWAVLNPLLMLTLYSFVFVFVFKIRWGSGPDTKGNFVILLFTGLVVHGFFAEFINRAPSLVSGSASYVKKVIFPLELLPLVPLLGAAINFVVGMGLISILMLLLQGSIPWTIFLLPLIVIPYAILTLGIVYFLSATGVYIRDLAHVVGLISTVAMFASPVLFPLDNVSEKYRFLLYFNPLTLVVEQLREVAILGIVPSWGALAIYLVVAIFVFLAGFSWFQATRRGFADVL